MPIYEYKCTSCGKTLEVIQKVGDKPLTRCTECSGKLEKLISRSAFQLKGGGWYNEGYGGGKAGGDASKSGAAPKADEPGGSKPEGGKKAAAGGCGSGSCGCH